MGKKTEFPESLRIWSQDGNWAGADTKREVASILLNQKNPCCAKDMAKKVGVQKKTVVNAIGELRFLNNTSSASKYAVRTYRKGRKFTYSLTRKAEGRGSKRELGIISPYIDRYYFS